MLPQAFIECAPAHPAYPSGHSTYVGAGITMIKAFADGTRPVAGPMRIGDAANGDSLTAITDQLSIDDELDKLAMNIGVGRLFAGVHWRSDHDMGLRLGELVAIRALQDVTRTNPEFAQDVFPGFTLRRFDGLPVLVTDSAVLRNGIEQAPTNVAPAPA